jgi:hypothetical protein
MNRTARWISTAAVAGLAVCLTAPPAPAQQPGMGFGGPGPIGGLTVNPANTAGGLSINPYANPYMNPNPGYSSPYYGYGNYVVDPYGGYLRGAADVINAQANFTKARQSAAIIKEQARQARLETQRKIFDQWLYELQKTPTAEEMRQVALRNELTRSLNQPTSPEITSGNALNIMLVPLADLLARTRPDYPAAPLDEDYVKRLNVTRADGNAGNIGLLRDKGELHFPIALTRLAPPEEMARAREQLAEYAKTAYNQALYGNVDQTTIREMENLVRTMNDRLTRGINDFDFTEYSEGKRFLSGLSDAIALLKQPDAGRWINGQNVARGKSVQELVRNMTGRGLRFAPANPNDGQVYAAVHTAMVNLYNGLQAQVAAATPPAPAAQP